MGHHLVGQLVQLTRLTTFLIFLADISVVLRGMTGLCRLTCEGHVGSWNPGPRAMTRQLAVVVPIVEDRPLANGFLAGPFCLRHILETHNIYIWIYIYIQYGDIEYVIIYICVLHIRQVLNFLAMLPRSGASKPRCMHNAIPAVVHSFSFSAKSW